MRARNIKPAFFKNDELSELTITARLLFIGLWCYADRDGFFEDRPKKIKAEIFPYDNIKLEHITQALASLVTSGFLIVFHNKNGNDIMQIVNFKKHQSPHHNEKPSILKDIIKTCNQGNNNFQPKKVLLPPDIMNDELGTMNDDIIKDDSVELTLSQFLLDLILKRKPDFKKPNIQSWAKDMDYLIRLDKRNPGEISKVIEWCQQDKFWSKNILSVGKLRKQYDRLVLEALDYFKAHETLAEKNARLTAELENDDIEYDIF